MLSNSRSVIFAMLSIACLALSVSAQPSARQLAAQEAADRIVKRFYETLDSGVVYREMYVRNERIRRAEVEIILGNMIRQGDHLRGEDFEKKRNIDFATMERGYVAMSNFHWLAAASAATYSGDKNKAMKKYQTEYEKYMAPLQDKTKWPMLTNEDVDEKLTASFNALADFFRGYVEKESFGTTEFWRRENSIEETRPPDTTDAFKALFATAGLKKDDHLEIVRKGRFYFYLLEENDGFRMLTWTDRVRS